jgi:hypothetical protein
LSEQFSLFAERLSGPEGLRYAEEFVSLAAEKTLIGHIAALTLQPFQFGQYEGKRRIASFGFRYDYTVRRQLIEFEKGKAGIVVGSKEKLPAVIDALIAAVRAGARPGLQPGSEGRSDRKAEEGRLIFSRGPAIAETCGWPASLMCVDATNR